MPRFLQWREGALCKWVVTDLPGPPGLCQVAEDERDPGSPDVAETFKELKVTPCGRAVSMPSIGQALLVKGNPFPL